MKLKLYQEKVLAVLKDYLSALADFKGTYKKALAIDPDIASDYNFPQRAFTKQPAKRFISAKQTALMNRCPMFI